jgi:hypothetical protein
LEALDRNESIDAIEIGTQRGCDSEIIVLAALSRPDLKNNSDHDILRSTTHIGLGFAFARRIRMSTFALILAHLRNAGLDSYRNPLLPHFPAV